MIAQFAMAGTIAQCPQHRPMTLSTAQAPQRPMTDSTENRILEHFARRLELTLV